MKFPSKETVERIIESKDNILEDCRLMQATLTGLHRH